MKNLARLLTMSAMLTAGSYAAPFLAVGDGAEIFLTGTVAVRADSNIFLAPDSTKDRSDTVIEAAPGFDLVFGKNSTVQGNWTVQDNFSSYSDHSKLNSNMFSTNFNAGFTDGKSKGTLNAGYVESNQNQVGDNALDYLIRRNTTNAGLTGEVAATEKTSVGAGLRYVKTDYLRAGFKDSEVMTVPLNYYYEVSPKVDLSLGYQYRKTWVKEDPTDRNNPNQTDSADNFFSLGARGEFTPKLSGQVNLGLTQRTFKHHGDVSLFGVDSNLSYAVSPKSSLQFGVSNDFDTNSQGQQQKNFAIRASGTTNISEQWSVTGGLSYRAINYYEAKDTKTGLPKPRTDDYVEAQVGVTYIVNANVRVTGAYAYRNNESDLSSSKFDDNVLTVTANFRY